MWNSSWSCQPCHVPLRLVSCGTDCLPGILTPLGTVLASLLSGASCMPLGAKLTLLLLSAGVSFFQYSYTTPNPYNNPLQLATTDIAFQTIAVPTAKYAANLVANKALAGCQKVTYSPAPSTTGTGSTAAAGRRLLSA